MNRWGNLPYYPISQFYLQTFGSKLQKLPVSISDTCPNRLGLKGMKTCIFCDEWGSAAFSEQKVLPLTQQIESKITEMGENYGSKDFAVYFQAYTSSFMGVKKLREHFDTALRYPQVKALVLGTRPDCLSDAFLELLNEYHQKKTFISLELGVQSFDEEDLVFLRRGHTGIEAQDAVKKVREKCNVDLGVHLIFGLPGETDEKILSQARVANELKVDNVKIHNLHVLANTPLHEMYLAGNFEPLSLEEYSRRVKLFLQHLSPKIAVHRLAALASRWEELVAPEWTKHKMTSYQFILDRLNESQSYQGQFFNS